MKESEKGKKFSNKGNTEVKEGAVWSLGVM